MQRSDATHVAVGSAFLGVGVLTLGILIPLAVAAKPHPWGEPWFLILGLIASALGLVGLYMLSAVYTGWWLPTTAAERAERADLSVEQADVVRIDGSHVYFCLGFKNDGRGAVRRGVAINILVPAFATSLDLTDLRGNLRVEGTTFEVPESIFTDEDGKVWTSLCWAGSIEFPGRAARPVYFRATLDHLRDMPVHVKVAAEELPKHLEQLLWVYVSSRERNGLDTSQGQGETNEDG